MKKSGLILLGFTLAASLAVMGQNTNGNHKKKSETATENHAQPHNQFSPEEFRARQQKFLTEKSGLTEEEADKFFPLYFELQQKKNEINFNARQTVNNRRDSGPLTDDEYKKLIDNLADAKIKTAQLEKEYLEKFKKIVPASKLLRIQIAETQFGSEMIKDIQRNAMHINGNRFPGIANMWNHMAVPFGFQPNGNPGAMQIPGMPGLPFRPDGNNQKQQQNNNNEKK